MSRARALVANGPLEQVERFNFVSESNRIEGITRPPTLAELAAHDELWALPTLCVADLEQFVATVAGRPLREHVGQDVRVGCYLPPAGGPEIRRHLTDLLDWVTNEDPSPYEAHVAYEKLHPFLDGNGRSGRAIWAWQHLRNGRDPFRLGFLWAFYYETLDAAGRSGAMDH